MRVLLAGCLAILISTTAFAADWKDQDEPASKSKGAAVETKDGVFGRYCREESADKASEYTFDVAKSGTCPEQTVVTLTIDGQSKSYQFECYGRDGGGALLILTADSRNERTVTDVADIDDRIQRAQKPDMSIRTNLTKRPMIFSLASAAVKMQRILKLCQQ
jgi:hypothetical protein